MSDALKQAFPDVNPGITPLGSRVLVQIRSPETKTKGGIIFSTNDRDTERDNTQVAKVVAVGPLAFHNRNTATLWPEGAWAGAGEFLRVPKYGGDRWAVEAAGGERAYFALFNDLDLLGKVTGDPLEIRAFY